MSRFLVKGKHFIVNHVWFESSKEFVIEAGYDKAFIHANQEKVDVIGNNKCHSILQHTLITDLSSSEEELWGEMTKTVRNEINRCKRENVTAQIYEGNKITDTIITSFSNMYKKMYEEKGMPGNCLNLKELEAYRKGNALIITTAAINGDTVVYHSYIKSENKSRFLHSCSEFRIQDNCMKNAIGRANKFLHWNDWMELKERGITEYDWGGISSYEMPNGIDKFKIAFGGVYRKYYNISFSCSVRAKAYEKLRSIMR